MISKTNMIEISSTNCYTMVVLIVFKLYIKVFGTPPYSNIFKISPQYHVLLYALWSGSYIHVNAWVNILGGPYLLGVF